MSDYEFDYPPRPLGRGLTVAVALVAALLVAGLGCAVAWLILRLV